MLSTGGKQASNGAAVAVGRGHRAAVRQAKAGAWTVAGRVRGRINLRRGRVRTVESSLRVRE